LFISTSLAMIFYFQDRLPSRVPVHFNGRGCPDRYGSRTEALVIFPIMQAFVCSIYLISFYLTQNPKYWKKKLRKPVSEQGLSRLISKSNQVVDWAMIWPLILFLYLQWQSLLIAIGKTQRLGPGLYVILALEFGGIVFFIIRLMLEQRRVLKADEASPRLQGS